MPNEENVLRAAHDLDSHVAEMIKWHFSPDTGCSFGSTGLMYKIGIHWKRFVLLTIFAKSFPTFEDEWLRDLPNSVWVPKAYEGRPFNILKLEELLVCQSKELVGTTFASITPAFSDTLNDDHFPRNHYWMMVGPTGPRRLRLAIEHLANERGCSCYFVDLDPRWVAFDLE